MLTYDCFRRLADKDVLLSDPMEYTAPMWADIFDLQWMGTSNYEYYGDRTPRMFEALRAGKTDTAMDLYWEVEPARAARSAEMAAVSSSNFVPRYLWKYQAWLNGYNGGPIRQPAMKLSDSQMRRAADGLIASGIIEHQPTDLAEYFVGRNPK